MKRMLLGCLVAMVMASGAAAQQGPGDHEGGPGKAREPRGLMIGRLLHNEEAAKQAGITEEQLTALRNLQYACKNSMIELRAQKDKLQLQMDQLMESDSVDKAAAEKLIDQMGKTETEIRKTMLNQQWQAREILGVEKYKELAKKQWQAVKNREKGPGCKEGKGLGRRGQPQVPLAAPEAEEGGENE